jgi:predicted nuclease of predicted toxin-antitoxin system
LKLKTDENLGRSACKLLREAGHSVVTVYEENLTSADDDRVIRAARDEGRCLVTLDIEFGNPFRYRPSEYRGIAVLRLPAKATPGILVQTLRTLLEKVDESISGHLWIVEQGRIRIYQPWDEDPLAGI